MPLIGDAVIGLTALIIAWLILTKKGLWVWTSIVMWNVVGIWDALSAFVIHLTNPWPDFFYDYMVWSQHVFCSIVGSLDDFVAGMSAFFSGLFYATAPPSAVGIKNATSVIYEGLKH